LSVRIRKAVVGLLVLALALTMVGAVGCSTSDEGAGGDGDEKMGGTLSYYISEPAFIDPVNLQESEGTQVGQAVFDSLVAFDPIDSSIVPAAAESWEPNEDATVWTFKLVDGATFHNGDPVTAADFKYAWERICNPENESEISYHLAPVVGYTAMQDGEATELEGVVAVDDTTLEVTLEYPFADFEYVVGHPALGPVPMTAAEEGVDYEGEMVDFSEMPIGNGPFMMAEPWAHDQYVKVVKNEDYYGDEPYIDGVDYMILADQDTAFLEFQAGNIDFTHIPTGQIESSVEEYGESPDGYTVAPGEQVLLGPETAIYYLLMNNEDEVLKDPEVRKALSLAINRQQIADKVFEGTRVPATGMVPPGMVGFQDDAWEYSMYDVEAAKTQLADAGYPDGEGMPVIKLEYNTGSGHEDILALVKDDLAALGIESELVGTEWAQYLDKLLEKTYQVGRLGWIADYPRQDNFLYPQFHSESGDNFAFYANEEVDAKLDEARGTTDADARVALYQEIETMIGMDAPVMPVVFYRHNHIGSDRINDGIFSPNGLFTFETVWLGEAGSSEE
jgi:peptide/nickel transport system substrate-binding protein/oligopeptide transport system substrate-binding protein